MIVGSALWPRRVTFRPMPSLFHAQICVAQQESLVDRGGERRQPSLPIHQPSPSACACAPSVVRLRESVGSLQAEAWAMARWSPRLSRRLRVCCPSTTRFLRAAGGYKMYNGRNAIKFDHKGQLWG